MNKEIRKQLKNYELNEKILDERFKNKKFKTDIGGGVRPLYDSLYYYDISVSYIDKYKLHELIDWIKTLLGTGANVHHPILYHINKEKAIEIVKEIIEIIKENEKMKNTKKEKTNTEKLVEKNSELKEPVKQKAKLTLADGREIEVEISEEEMKKLAVKKNPYEIVNTPNEVYYVNPCGVVDCDKLEDLDQGFLTGLEGNINIYNDYDFAEKCARADLLMRKLRKFAIESRIFNRPGSMYQIFFDDYDKIPYSSPCADINTGNILFTSEAACKKAIETFHDELIWYFTEYLKIYE